MRFLEEEVHTLRLQLVQAQNEMSALRRDADHLRRCRHAVEAERNMAVAQLEVAAVASFFLFFPHVSSVFANIRSWKDAVMEMSSSLNIDFHLT